MNPVFHTGTFENKFLSNVSWKHTTYSVLLDPPLVCNVSTSIKTQELQRDMKVFFKSAMGLHPTGGSVHRPHFTADWGDRSPSNSVLPPGRRAACSVAFIQPFSKGGGVQQLWVWGGRVQAQLSPCSRWWILSVHQTCWCCCVKSSVGTLGKRPPPTPRRGPSWEAWGCCGR